MSTHLYEVRKHHIKTKNVLVTGASGNLGAQVAEALIKYGENISLLVRQESVEKPAIKKLTNLGGKLIIGDLSDESSLAEILKDFDAVVCVHKGNTVHQTIVDAAKKYNRVKLIVAALWTMFNPEHSKPGENPIADVHRVTMEIMKKSDIPYVGVLNGAFAEYAFLSDFLGLNLPSGNATIYGDGNQKIYTTSTADIAKLAPYILNDKSKIGKLVSIAADCVTPNKAIEIFEKHSGKKIEKKYVSETELDELIKKSSGFATVALKSQKNLYFGNLKFDEPTNGTDYPDVKLLTVDEFAKNFYEKLKV